jgi:hypothetical protein
MHAGWRYQGNALIQVILSSPTRVPRVAVEMTAGTSADSIGLMNAVMRSGPWPFPKSRVHGRETRTDKDQFPVGMTPAFSTIRFGVVTPSFFNYISKGSSNDKHPDCRDPGAVIVALFG